MSERRVDDGDEEAAHSGSPVRDPRSAQQTGPLAPSEAERAARARARGLDAPSIPGGHDPDPDEGLREDRRYGRILLIVVAAIVLAGFVLGILANLLTGQ